MGDAFWKGVVVVVLPWVQHPWWWVESFWRAIPRVLGAAGAEAGCGMLLFHRGMLAAVLLCQREPGTTAPGPQQPG